MGQISTGFSMSLDGFIAEPDDSCDRLFKWYATGGPLVEVTTGGGSITVSEPAAEKLHEAAQAAGALMAGRRLFEFTHGWGGKHPLDVPIVVVSHRPAPEWAKPEWPVIFVTDGFEAALAKAQEIAGEKKVLLSSASLVQQALKRGTLEEIQIDLVPILLGAGIPLFAELGIEPVDLEITDLMAGPDVTHITYHVKRPA